MPSLLRKSFLMIILNRGLTTLNHHWLSKWYVIILSNHTGSRFTWLEPLWSRSQYKTSARFSFFRALGQDETQGPQHRLRKIFNIREGGLHGCLSPCYSAHYEVNVNYRWRYWSKTNLWFSLNILSTIENIYKNETSAINKILFITFSTNKTT